MASVRYGDGSTCDIPFARLRAADFAESLPWRRVRSVHGMLHHSGEYASASTGGQVVYESRLELVWLLLADCDPAVVNIFAQPCRVVARVDGRVRSHVPDFLLVMRSGTVRVVNVKPAERAQDPTIAEALAWPGRLVERHGWEYEVWTGADPVLLENVRFLAGYRHPGIVPAGEIERAWREVVDGEELAVAERQLAGGGPREVTRPPPPARTTASSPGSRHEHLDAGQDPDRPRAAARRSPGQLDQQLRALRTTNRGFLHHIGLPAARVDPMLLGLTTPETQALHKATGVPAEVLRAMTLDSYDTFAVNIAPGRRQLERPPAWAFRSSRTRYCPACLHENGGRGLLLWRLPWASHAPNTSCSWPTSVPPAPARPTRGRSASRGPATSASAHATDSTTQPRAAGALVPPTCSTPRRSPFPPMIWS